MKYGILVYGEPSAFEELSAAERERAFGEFWGLAREPGVVASGFLPPNEIPTTVRVREGRTVASDGPFAETKEVFGGFYLLEVPERAAAIAFAGRVPAESVRGHVEIWPVAEVLGLG